MNSLWTGLQFDTALQKARLARLMVWQKREFLYILMAAFVLGLLPVMWFGFAAGLLLPLFVAVVVLSLAGLLLNLPEIFYVVLVLLGTLWGGIDMLQTESFAVAENEAVYFTGTVVEVAGDEENYFAHLAEFDNKAVSFVMRGKTDDGWCGRLMIVGYEGEVRPGDKLRLAAVVQEFTQTRNFGLLQNDYLLDRGIGAVALAVRPTVSFAKLASKYSPVNLGLAIREQTFAQMEGLPQEQQALLKGIGFGEMGMLTAGDKAVLQQTGIMHVFAVSGMHIAYVTMLAGAVLEFVRRRLHFDYRFVVIGSMAVVLAFCLVVGFSPSVVRSAIMSMAALASLLLLKPHSAGHALVAAAFVMLLYQPRWLVQPGFIMSFLATAAIIYNTRTWRVLVPNNALAATLAAQFAVLPVVAYFYNTVSLVGFVISPLVAFGSGVVVMLVLLAMVLGAFGLGLVPLAGAGLLAQGMYKLAEVFAALPGSFTYTPRPTVLAIVLYYVLLAAAYLILEKCRNGAKYEQGFECKPEENAEKLSQGQKEL